LMWSVVRMCPKLAVSPRAAIRRIIVISAIISVVLVTLQNKRSKRNNIYLQGEMKPGALHRIRGGGIPVFFQDPGAQQFLSNMFGNMNATLPTSFFINGNKTRRDLESLASELLSKFRPKEKSIEDVRKSGKESPISDQLDTKLHDKCKEQAKVGKKKPVYIRKQIPADVFEGKDKLIIRADIPGVVKDNIKVECLNNILRVSVTRRTAAQPPEGIKRTAHHNEIPQGTYSRSFKIPDSVDVSSIKASYDDGVLMLTMAKKPKPQLLTIPVA